MLLLTSPFTPMLWMGEEWAASTRWPFFTSHPEPELGKATGEGRVAEFAGHGWDVSQMIDPQDPEAYRTAILDWSEPEQGDHAAMLGLYRSLIALRAAEPDLRDGDLHRVAGRLRRGRAVAGGAPRRVPRVRQSRHVRTALPRRRQGDRAVDESGRPRRRLSWSSARTPPRSSGSERPRQFATVQVCVMVVKTDRSRVQSDAGVFSWMM